MPLKLSELKWAPGARHHKKRVGRGHGSGNGKTAGRGHKGQNSRTGGGTRAGFEGGQNPIYRRIPKRGFRNAPFRKIFTVINVGQLDKLSETTFTIDILRKTIADSKKPIKLLADGELKKALTIEVHGCSETAKQKVEKAGGKITLIPWRA
jgi:large subunit ribosomal protein L15